MNFKCPGSISVTQPIPEFFICPDCGAEVEIWTNENMRRCDSCGRPIHREIDSASCVQWCQGAKECIGAERYQELLRKGVISVEMEEQTRIPEKLKKLMRECDIPIPGEDD